MQETRRYAYPARLERVEDNRLLATFRDIRWAKTDGADRAEALAQASDCLAAALAYLADNGEAIPTPSRRQPGEVVVPVLPRTAAKLALRRAMAENSVGIRELARRMALDPKAVQRLLDTRHRSDIDALSVAVLAADGPALELCAQHIT